MLTGLMARARSLWNGLRGRDDVEEEMAREFAFHVEMRAEHFVRLGYTRAEAVRRAKLEFGSAEHHKDRARQARGLRRFDDLGVSWLDFKLGFRMLARYPGLTLVGGLAIAFATAVGAGAFEFINQLVFPTLPLPEGSRVVALRNWNVTERRQDDRLLHDLVTWREQVTTVREIGAERTVQRNLVVGADGRGEPALLAEMSAVGFRLTRVPPLLGRTLVDADERPDAPPVIVLGHQLWQLRFAGDSAVIGRTVRVAGTPHQVVGVMPQGYTFPSVHQAWVPLRLDPLAWRRGEGPSISRVFGRLAPGVTLEEAQAELTTIGNRASADFPATHRDLRAQVLPYIRPPVNASELSGRVVLSINLFVAMLVMLVFANVALLMFARAAARESEIAVRTALGASRGRIVTQLFAEALVLGGVGAALGLVLARVGLRLGFDMARVSETLPFWYRDTLQPATVVYAVVLTLLGAVIAGVMPALKITRGVTARLRELGAGGGGLRFGGVWTAIIVAQVAVTVAFPVTAFFERRDAVQLRTYDAGLADAQYLVARPEVDREAWAASRGDTSAAFLRGMQESTLRELERRLESEPGVAGVTFAEYTPKMWHPQRRIEIEGGMAPAADSTVGHRVSSAAVAEDFVATFGKRIHAGRAFSSADVATGAPVAIVNQSFVKEVLGGRNPIGRRMRYTRAVEEGLASEPSPWYEIVGVADDIGMESGGDPWVTGKGVYHPLPLGAAQRAYLIVHVPGGARSLLARVRGIATEVDESLRLHAPVTLDALAEDELRTIDFAVRLTLVVCAIALMLSLAAIYAVMSFAVSRRTREIGIRMALGSDRRRVLLAVFARPLRQVSYGVLAGSLITGWFVLMIYGDMLTAGQVALVVGYALLMLAVCLLACVVPTRRALAVQPTEALRSE